MKKVMKIALFSDTHGHLDARLADWCAPCDEVWHAGDLGSVAVADEIESWKKPVRIVHGNIDEPALRQRYPESLWFTCAGLRVWMIHIAGSPPRYAKGIRPQLTKRRPQLLVCGHSHILRVINDPALDLLYVNPGAAGNQGFHTIKTALRFEITGGKVTQMEIFELGKRGSLA